MLYVLATELLLHRLRHSVIGLIVAGNKDQSQVSLAAYAGDVTVYIRRQEDLSALGDG